MPVDTLLAMHLPSLRRFSQALTGSRQVGDTYVFMTLEAVTAEPRGARRRLPPRADLFRVLLAIWLPMACSFDDRETDKGREPMARAALLLHRLEGWEVAAIAAILDVTQAEAFQLVGFADGEVTADPRRPIDIGRRGFQPLAQDWTMGAVQMN